MGRRSRRPADGVDRVCEKKPSPAKRDKESESRVAAAGTAVPHSLRPFHFQSACTRFEVLLGATYRSPHSSRRAPKEVSPPMLVERVYDDSSAGIASATTCVTLDKSKGGGAVGWKTIVRRARVRRGNSWTGKYWGWIDGRKERENDQRWSWQCEASLLSSVLV